MHTPALWALALAGAAVIPSADACSSFLVGRKASADGSVISFHTDDASGDGGVPLAKVPEQDWPANATHRTGIPQVPHTYGYYTAGYPSLNQWRVAMVESTCSAVYAAKSRAQGGHAYLGMSDLMGLGLERAKTAKEAVEVMGALAEEWGFHGEDPFPGGGESVMVSDPNDAWVVHFLPDPTGRSAIWGAARVPEDHITAVTNCFIIRDMDLNDGANYLGAANISREAAARGWEPSKPLDFSLYFSHGEYNHPYYAGRRTWRSLSMFAPSLQLDPYYNDLIRDRPYPMSVKPDRPVSVRDAMRLSRDHYEGTEFDTSVGLAAGVWGSPRRWDGGSASGKVEGWWERTIGLYRTDLVNLLQVRSGGPDAVGGVMWHAPHVSDAAAFLPFPIGLSQEDLPKGLTTVPKDVDRDTAYWANLLLYNVMEIKYSYMVKDVRAFQDRVEAAGAALLSQEGATAADYAAHAAAVIRETAALSDTLIQHYPDGYCNGCGHGLDHDIPYPDWWLKAVNYTNPKVGPAHPVQAPPATPAACVAKCPEDTFTAYKECVERCL